MKNWLLYFFAIFISVGSVGVGSKIIYEEESVPKLTVSFDGDIREVTVEEYSLLVLLSEYEDCTDSETRKALAVSARSVGLYLSVFGCKHEDFDACNRGDCCISLGTPADTDEQVIQACREAVSATEGLVLADGELPAMALFCTCTGSGSGDCREFPYLVSVAEKASCQVHITEEIHDYSLLTPVILSEANANLAEEGAAAVYDDSGKCSFAIIGGKYIPAHKIINALSLQSSEFTLEFLSDGIKTLSRGVGHGYGMSLCGAEKMAGSGYEYEKILENYYPNLILKKLYNN